MDVLGELKGYISSFRVRELCECLSRLGVRYTGNKVVLVERLNEVCQSQHAAGLLSRDCKTVRVVVAVHREMLCQRAQESAARRMRSVAPGLQCLCKHPLETPASRVVHCVTPGCGICEHVFCLFHSNRIPEWSEKEHRCIQCRSNYADPFWKPLKNSYVVHPSVLTEVHQRVCYGNVDCASDSDLDANCDFLLRHLLQLDSNWCPENSSSVKQKYRTSEQLLQGYIFHWPMNCKLSINAKELRVYPRHADNKITEGQRDEPLDISQSFPPHRDRTDCDAVVGKFVHMGKNTIEISCQDTNQYAFFIQIERPVERDEVLGMMHEPENLDAARMRMRRIVRGQVLDDVDDEVQTMTVTMSLKCPFSSKRIKIPARLLNIDSLECVFDLDAFISMAQKTRKWACPHSLHQSSIHYLARDAWLEVVLKALQHFPEIEEIEVSKEGAWRLRGETKWRGIYNTAVIEKLPEGVAAPVEPTNGADQMLDNESEDEEEELRQAALAAKQAYKKHYQEISRSQNLEVVDLVSSDGETDLQPQTQTEASLIDAEQGSAQQASLLPEFGQGGFSRPTAASYDIRQGPFQRAFAEQTGFAFQDARNDFLSSFQPVQQVQPVPVSWPPPCYRATTNVPAGLPHSHCGGPQYQRRSREGPYTISTINLQTPMPPISMPRQIKRAGPLVDGDAGQRKVGRLNRRLRKAGGAEQPVPHMECIEIDDSE